ncbi:hypothetical protein SBOR_8057 [Sclerotinia borealis F-4128]|uniref:Rhodopsin domain-containing protein n=1 Tax=Sclerotinia borealis (strain F-4128) TaxID=1432307 RepID=W9C6S0_SCLBF|nr:hypothetical protein SBOR_8057 [Sclerotinia borealis F-4128]
MSTLWVYNSTPEVNAQSNYPLILGVSSPLLLLMLITVGTRLYVRVRTVRGIGADDWAVVIAALCSIIYNSCTIAQSRWGLGLPLALRPLVNLNTYSVVNYAGRPFYMMGILGFKVSLCFSYLRILSMGQPKYRLLVWFVMILCILGHLAGTFVLIFNCNPVQRSWHPATNPGTCLPVGPLFLGLAITSIVFDVIIFFLPIPFLYGLRMDKRRKFGIIAVFALGIFTTVCSIMRMTEIPVIATGSGNSTMLVLWGNIELNVGIILTCMPVLAPLFKVFSKKLISSGKTSGSNPYAHTGSHNMQVFTNSKSQQRATVTNFNSSGNVNGIGNVNARVLRASKYPGDVSDNESQETILGKGGRDKEGGGYEGSEGMGLGSQSGRSGISEDRRRSVDRSGRVSGSWISDESKGGDGDENRNDNGLEFEGIMRTVRVDVSSEERGLGEDVLDNRRGNM